MNRRCEFKRIAFDTGMKGVGGGGKQRIKGNAHIGMKDHK
jgi:hypothetical protein